MYGDTKNRGCQISYDTGFSDPWGHWVLGLIDPCRTSNWILVAENNYKKKSCRIATMKSRATNTVITTNIIIQLRIRRSSLHLSHRIMWQLYASNRRQGGNVYYQWSSMPWEGSTLLVWQLTTLLYASDLDWAFTSRSTISKCNNKQSIDEKDILQLDLIATYAD